MNKFLKIFLLQFVGAGSLLAQTDSTTEEKAPNWEKTLTWGANLSHTYNINQPASIPKQGLGYSNSMDIGINYVKDSSRLQATNTINWLFTMGKADVKSRTVNTADQFLTFHDVFYKLSKKGKFSSNIIIKTETPIFTLFEESFLKDYNQLGPIKSFLNPYTVVISPGIKYEFSPKNSISLSPYSTEIFGLNSQFIADKGEYISDRRSDGHYETKKVKPNGAELNIWLNKKIKKRFDYDYKFGVLYNYNTNDTQKGNLRGQFITNYLIFKGLKLSHRAKINGVFDTNKDFKPYYSQTILLSYTLQL